MPKKAKNYSILLFIFPILIIVGEFLFYFLDDFLDEGHDFFYLDNYGRGFLTWWLDSETFWGNFEYNIMKSLIFAGFLLMYSRRSDIFSLKPMKENRTIKILILLLIICISPSLIFITYSPGSGESLNIINIIFGGWFSSYMAYNIMDFLLFIMGFWVVIIVIYGFKNNYEPIKYNYYSMIFVSISFALLIHLSLVGIWSIESIVHLGFLMDTAIFLVFVFPLTLGLISLITKEQSREDTSLKDNKKYWKLHISIRLILTILIALIVILSILASIDPMYLTIDLGIDIGSDWIPRNFSSWVFISLLTAILYYFGIRGLSKEGDS